MILKRMEWVRAVELLKGVSDNWAILETMEETMEWARIAKLLKTVKGVSEEAVKGVMKLMNGVSKEVEDSEGS